MSCYLSEWIICRGFPWRGDAAVLELGMDLLLLLGVLVSLLLLLLTATKGLVKTAF